MDICGEIFAPPPPGGGEILIFLPPGGGENIKLQKLKVNIVKRSKNNKNFE